MNTSGYYTTCNRLVINKCDSKAILFNLFGISSEVLVSLKLWKNLKKYVALTEDMKKLETGELLMYLVARLLILMINGGCQAWSYTNHFVVSQEPYPSCLIRTVLTT